jgi:hypothetical protein
MSADEPWSPPDLPPAVAGFQFDQQQAALLNAFRLFDAEQVDETLRFGRRKKSIGAFARGQDDVQSWIKVVCLDGRAATWMRDGELSAPDIAGVPRPRVVRSIEWRTDGIAWCAIQFAAAPSPAAAETSALSKPLRIVDDGWLRQLKQAIDRVGQAPLTRWCSHPGTVARAIACRFGRDAPVDIDEWRTAHGDLNWGNVTAPALTLLDWEHWGAAPRGYDAATLLTHSVADPVTTEKIADLFADDLNSRSGVVAQLYAVAFLLDQIEAGFGDPRRYRALEALGKRLMARRR